MAWIDIDLRDVDDRELIRELEDRYFDEREQATILDIVKGCASDKMKFFLSVMDRYSMSQLEEMFSEKFIHSVSKEQLTLPLFDAIITEL